MSFSDVLSDAVKDSCDHFQNHCHSARIQLQDLDRRPEYQWYAFFLALLMVMRIAESQSATLKLLSLLCKLSPAPQVPDVERIMERAIQIYGASSDTALEVVSRDVLPSVLTTPEQFWKFFSRQCENSTTSEAQILVALAMLQFGKNKAFLSDSGKTSW